MFIIHLLWIFYQYFYGINMNFDTSRFLHNQFFTDKPNIVLKYIQGEVAQIIQINKKHTPTINFIGW